MRYKNKAARLAGAACMACLVLGAGVGTASADPTGFTSGDLVIDQTSAAPGQTAPSNLASPVQLVDYSTAGTASGFSVALPTADGSPATGDHALSDSGTATYDGEITLSTDNQSILVPGYDYPPSTAEGTTGLTSETGVVRTIGLVGVTGSIDTTTSLSDSTTEANNFRSVAGSSTAFYSGDGGGSAYETDGGTASYLDTKNVHQVEVFGGQLYESNTSHIYEVGTGLPTSGTQTDTALTLTNAPSGFEPAGFLLLAVNSTSPNTLYVADTANSKVEEYTGSGSSWTLAGSVTVDQVTGLVGLFNGTAVDLYATGGTSPTAAYNSVLYGIVDPTGNSGFSSATVTTLANAPTGDSWHGIAFAPTVVPTEAPEAPWAVLLPLSGAALIGGGILVHRRRQVGLSA